MNIRTGKKVAIPAVLLLLLSCTGPSTSRGGLDSPLLNAMETPEALARAALDALVEGDEEGLVRLMVSREEYEELLWPSLPDRDYMPFDFAWSLTGPRSRKARQEALAEFAGSPLKLVRVELGDSVEEYDAFTLFLDARMTVRSGPTGAEWVLPLMDVLVRMGEGWKFLNFGEDV